MKLLSLLVGTWRWQTSAEVFTKLEAALERRVCAALLVLAAVRALGWNIFNPGLYSIKHNTALFLTRVQTQYALLLILLLWDDDTLRVRCNPGNLVLLY